MLHCNKYEFGGKRRTKEIPLNFFFVYQGAVDAVVWLYRRVNEPYSVLGFWCLVKRECLIQTFSISVGICFIFWCLVSSWKPKVTGYCFYCEMKLNFSMHSCLDGGLLVFATISYAYLSSRWSDVMSSVLQSCSTVSCMRNY